ncbi:MAG: hypothetical protein KDB16_15710, partial [Acidimicrobiales bacterium]|nr:hypothetical protein [Acidimicrobiales bacterium]
AHLLALPLPGGDEGVRNPCRTAVAYAAAVGLDLDHNSPAVVACDPTELKVVRRQVERNIGCVPTTSMGRLFDVVSSLIGVRHRVGYEAQAAIELEFLAGRGREQALTLAFSLHGDVIDPAPVLAGVADAVAAGVAPADIALAFHHAVADMVAAVAERFDHPTPVGLTGGVFQNTLLTRLVTRRLVGRTVLTHRLVPPNDGGLALGQAVVAGRQLNERNRPSCV